MSKGNTLKYLEGGTIGLALGVAAALFLTSKKGKQLTKNVGDVTAEFYKYIAPKVKKMEKMGEAEYKLFMKNAAIQYVKTKKLSGDIAKDLVKDAQQSWKHFSRHLAK